MPSNLINDSLKKDCSDRSFSDVSQKFANENNSKISTEGFETNKEGTTEKASSHKKSSKKIDAEFSTELSE